MRRHGTGLVLPEVGPRDLALGIPASVEERFPIVDKTWQYVRPEDQHDTPMCVGVTVSEIAEAIENIKDPDNDYEFSFEEVYRRAKELDTKPEYGGLPAGTRGTTEIAGITAAVQLGILRGFKRTIRLQTIQDFRRALVKPNWFVMAGCRVDELWEDEALEDGYRITRIGRYSRGLHEMPVAGYGPSGFVLPQSWGPEYADRGWLTIATEIWEQSCVGGRAVEVEL